jgi:predicted RNA-binding protein YlqC (UPF0109 family)
MEDLLNKIISTIVDKPEEIDIEQTLGEHTIIYKLSVAKEDTGKVIGKDGKTADAIRTILRAVGSKQKKKIILEIKDSFNDTPIEQHNREPYGKNNFSRF